MSDVVEMLKRERAELEAQLQADPRYVKIQKINDLLAAYGVSDPVVTAVAVPVEPIATPAPPAAIVAKPATPTNHSAAAPRNRKRRKRGTMKANFPSKKAGIHAVVARELKKHGSRHRSELLATLEAEGLMGKETRPIASLAAYLSDWRSDFVPDGKGNFSLASEEAVAKKNEPADSPHGEDTATVSIFEALWKKGEQE